MSAADSDLPVNSKYIAMFSGISRGRIAAPPAPG